MFVARNSFITPVMDDLRCTENLSSHNDSISPNSHETDQEVENIYNPVCAYDKAIFLSSRVLDRMNKSQHLYLPDGEYLNPNRTPVSPNVRTVLVQWMLEVCEHEQAESQVFVVAVNILDRFLSSTAVQRSQLQLTACACLLIASKIRQCLYLGVKLLAYFTENSVSQSEIRQWEILILAKLGWDVCPTTSIDFVEPLISGFPDLTNAETVRAHAHSYTALVATDSSFVDHLPSHIAAAVVSVAMEGLNVNIPNALVRLATALRTSVQELQPTRSLVRQAVNRYFDELNSSNNNNTDYADEGHFLEETAMIVEETHKNSGSVTPSDVTDIIF